MGYIHETGLKDYEAALFNYVEFIRLSQDPVKVYEIQKRVANIHFEQGKDPEKSIAAYKKLLALQPESLEADFFQFRIGQSYFFLNNFDQARMEYEQLLEKYPKSQYIARTRFEIGNSYYMEGKYDTAVEALKQVIRKHPQSDFSSEAEFMMAQCLEQSGKLSDALHAYENVRERYSSMKIIDHRITELKKRIKKER